MRRRATRDGRRAAAFRSSGTPQVAVIPPICFFSQKLNKLGGEDAGYERRRDERRQITLLERLDQVQ